MSSSNLIRPCIRWSLALAILALTFTAPASEAQQSEEFDDYKIKLDAAWFYSRPTGYVKAQSDSVPVDLRTDLNFGSYSTFAGKWTGNSPTRTISTWSSFRFGPLRPPR